MMGSLTEQLAAVLGPGLELERELGGGGMSRVYIALDRRLGRRIVVKLLAPELASGVSADRFEQEILLAAGLQHPHIVPLLAAGEVSGLPYFTMPFIEGESLRQRLTRSGPLPTAEAVRLLAQVASALAYAHDRGLIHRDIKPDNVLLSAGGAMVTDFGVAKALRAATTTATGETSSGLTSAGMALGTPAYMAPEQAVGDPATDARADLYALGAMAYECLTGNVPFPGRSAQAMIAAHLTEPPPPLGERHPDLPSPLTALVMRCLAKRPEDRPASAVEVTESLEEIRISGYVASAPLAAPAARTVTTPAPESSAAGTGGRRNWQVGGALLMIALLALLAIARRATVDGGPNPTPARTSTLRIAVLPFDNIGDSADAYFADGVADAVRGKLTELPGVEVIARGSSVRYAGTKVLPADVAKELGVRYLLTGTVRWAKGPSTVSRVQVAPELVAVGGNAAPATEWSERYDAPLTDVFRVQGEIASQVAQALGLKLGVGDARRLAARLTSDIAAYDAYLRAEEFARMAETSVGVSSSDSAIRYYREAVARDSGFARAWAGLAGMQSVNFINSGRPAGGGRPIRDILACVERLAPEAPETAYLRAQVAYNVDADTAKAFGTMRDALQRFPANAQIVQFAGVLENQVGHFDAALAYARRGLELDPKSTTLMSLGGMAALMARRYADARPLLDRMQQLQPNNPDPTVMRAASYLGEGDLVATRRTLAEAQGRFGIERFTTGFFHSLGEPWVLDSAQRRAVLGTSVAAFDGFITARALSFSAIEELQGDTVAARRWADSTLAGVAEDARGLGKANPFLSMARAVAEARLGHYERAIASAAQAVRLSEADRIGFIDPGIRLAAAQVLTRAGRRDEAVARLEEVLRAQYMVSAAWLALDPSLASLRGHPRFDRIVPPR